MLRRIGVLAVVLFLGLALTVTVLQQRWHHPLAIDPSGYLLVVEPGETLRDVADGLQAAGVYAHPALLRLYGRWTGLDQQLRHGEYLVPAGTSAAGLLQLLREGRVLSYQVTLPEGITLARALATLAADGRLEPVLSGPDDPRLLALVAPHASAEGWFFPDSYRFERGATDWDILQRAHQAMRVILNEEWEQRAPDLPYASPYDALIMASIVERETGLPQERPAIAGVFVRRLQKHMLLQTDPTVIYGLGPAFDGNLQRAHLRDASNPYNTYRHAGLPPTPIALPGRAALHAALHPDAGKALYFVARGDGGHVFSETLAQHERAVRKYQLQRSADYRSTPDRP